MDSFFFLLIYFSVMFILFYSVALSFSNNNWMLIWMFLEFNSMSFLLMILMDKNLIFNDFCMKYFLVQSIGSIILLIFYSFSFNQLLWYGLLIKNFFMIIFFALSLKMAMAPFHSWIMKMGMNLSLIYLSFLLLWQKFIPIFMMITISKLELLLLASLLSIVIGTMSQFNLSSIYMILIFSSISHLAWLMVTSFSFFFNSFIYLIIYTFLMIMIFFYMMNMNVKYFYNLMEKNMFFCISLLMFSLAGIPPLMGFIPKWMIIMEMVKNNLNFLIILFFFMATVNFYIYMQIIYSSLFMNILSKLNLNFKKYLIFIYINMIFPIIFFIFL